MVDNGLVDMSIDDQIRLRDALLRQRLSAFIERCFAEIDGSTPYRHNWHIDALAHHLTEVKEGRIRRLLITLPPRSLKSISASIAFPAWLLGHDPSKRIICVSYGQELAVAHSNSFRKIIKADWYRHLFPHTRVDPRKDTELECHTMASGYRMTTTIGGALTGRGGSIVIIDDPMKAADANSEAERRRVKTWFDQTLLTRLDDKTTGAIIIVMQRLHVDDLAGHVLDHEGFVHLNLPAIAPELAFILTDPVRFKRREPGDILDPHREPLSVLEDLMRRMGSATFSAQYLQDPVPPTGNMVDWDWFQVRQGDDRPAAARRTGREMIVQSWDTATKANELSDYSACVTARVLGKEVDILNVYRGRLDYPALRKKIIGDRNRWDADTVLIEDKGSGSSLIADLKGQGFRTVGITPDGDKIVRMSACSAMIEQGSVSIPNEATWIDDFRQELLAFPQSRHDDQVDALSQLLNWVRTRSRYTLDNL